MFIPIIVPVILVWATITITHSTHISMFFLIYSVIYYSYFVIPQQSSFLKSNLTAYKKNDYDIPTNLRILKRSDTSILLTFFVMIPNTIHFVVNYSILYKEFDNLGEFFMISSSAILLLQYFNHFKITSIYSISFII